MIDNVKLNDSIEDGEVVKSIADLSMEEIEHSSPWDLISRPNKDIDKYSNKDIGREGEQLAQLYLRKRGMKLLECNWKCNIGEVDIVAKDGDEVVLIEVKTRLQLDGDTDVMPELSVNSTKQKKYRQMALLYLAFHGNISRIRFDVIAINIVGDRMARLRHLVSAFVWDEK